MKDVKVSIICNTYNHEKYIADALESFVMQKTDFLFEILVHDDASTDNTADIIREYEKKYPDIVKPIYQMENQYSQGLGLVSKIQYARVRGKYIAVCEGDDYWSDTTKLQKQYDAMELHPELDICAHKSEVIDALTSKHLYYVEPSSQDTILSTEQVIKGGGGFVSTNSLFYRAELNKNLPSFRKILSLDYVIQVHGALRGGMLYLSSCMSVYRNNVESSWTVNSRNDINTSLRHHEKVIQFLSCLNVDTNKKYENIIRKRIHNANKNMLYTIYCSNIKYDEDELKWVKDVSLLERVFLRIRYELHLIKKFLCRLK